MMDHKGKTIFVGWAAHEIVWLTAAAGLPNREQREAYEDIADMSGRTFAAVQRQANRMAAGAREIARRARIAAEQPERVILPAAPLAPSTLNTSARMMAMRMGARA